MLPDHHQTKVDDFWRFWTTIDYFTTFFVSCFKSCFFFTSFVYFCVKESLCFCNINFFLNQKIILMERREDDKIQSNNYILHYVRCVDHEKIGGYFVANFTNARAQCVLFFSIFDIDIIHSFNFNFKFISSFSFLSNGKTSKMAAKNWQHHRI